ncbi:MAG: exonuclease SbcC, partial [Natronomonas sp.]
HAKTVRENATDLAADISEYVTEAREEDLDATERERIQVERELRACREDRETQERARVVHEHDRLRDRLETYRDATATLDDRYEYTQAELETLTSLSETIASATGAIDDADAEIASLEADVEEWESELASAERELAMLDRREGAVAETEAALEDFRDAREDEGERDRWLQTTGRVALVGLALGGTATAAGALDGGVAFLALAAILLGVGVLAAGAWAYSLRQAAAVANRRAALLEQARDAGFDVEAVSEIQPAIQRYHDERAELESQIDDLEQDIKVDDRMIDEHEATISDARERRQTSREEKREILRAADVDDVNAYRSALSATSELETDRSNARQSLDDALGEPDVADPNPQALIEYWETKLAAMVADLDADAVDPDEYDEERLGELRERESELEDRKAELETTLEAHESKIQEFRNRARDLRSEPFRDEPLTLTAETIDGLEQLQADLDALTDRITRDAEISRIGLQIFDEIHNEEEEKITDLFDTNGRASDVFATLTDDRYTDVTYDTHTQQLHVETHDGTVHTPDELSHGTRDQLHFATRISLAEQLLGTEPGFLVLDDAFLPADPTRLDHGFEILQDLAANDWQIIYLTAKQEIGESVVEERDLERIDLEPLP